MKLPRREQGMTLLMALIMLIVLTLLALSSFNLTQANMQVVTNMQQRDAVTFAARGVLDEVLSSKKFHTDPLQTLAQQPGCTGINKRCLDTNGDTVNDVTVRVAVAPKCVKVKTIKTSELNLDNPEEEQCSVQQRDPGLQDNGNGQSRCADSVWEVQVVAEDDISKAKMTVTQGIGVRVPLVDILQKCPD